MTANNELGELVESPVENPQHQSDDKSDRRDLEAQTMHDHIPSSDVDSDGSSKDSNIVNWDGPEDSENPLQWSSRKKITAISIVSFLAFLS